jgi:two-component system, chemotaxis family, sensor histidine kinase and response regulator WspE
VSELVEIFRDEVDTNLKEATRLALALELAAPRRADTEALMRVFHTLKGAARAIGFEQEKTVAHLLEDVYHDVLDGSAEPQPALADLSLAAVDLIRGTVAARLAGQPLPDPGDFATRVAAYRAGPPAAPETTAAGAEPADPGFDLGDGLDLIAIFRAEAETHLDEAAALLAKPDSAGGDLRRVFHTLKGAARAIGCDPIRRVAGAVEALFHADGADDAAPAGASQRRAADCALGWVRVLLDALLADRPLPVCSALLEYLAALGKGATAGDCPPPPAGAPHAAQEAAIGPAPPPRPVAPSPELAPADARSPQPAAASQPSSGAVSDTRVSPEQRPNRARTSVAYEQLDRLQRLSGELTVAVGALNAQRGQIVALKRLLGRTTQQLNRVVADGGGRDALLELLRERLPLLAEVGGGLDALTEGQDRLDGRLQHLVDGLASEVTQARLVPLSDLLDDYPRMVRDLGRELGKQVELRLDGTENRIDRAVLEQIRSPLLHLVRNAIDHGIETAAVRVAAGKPAAGRLYIEARQLGSMMRIRVADDGAGIDQDRLKRRVIDGGHTTAELWAAMDLEERMQFLFLPGLSTAEQVSTTSGRGFGLDIVKTVLDGTGGQVGVHSETGRGTVFELRVPLSLALTRCLLVVAGRHPLFGVQRCALPMHDVARVERLHPDRLREVQGRMAVRIGEETLPLFQLGAMLGLAPVHADLARKHLIVLGEADSRYALAVDEVTDELDLVSRPLDERLGKVRRVAAPALLNDGGLALILDVPDLLEQMHEHAGQAGRVSAQAPLPARYPAAGLAPPEPPEQEPHLLVVEDSATVREVERHFLEQAGYRVTTAVNGMDGLNKARGGDYRMLITDIDMPRMNGIELIRTLRGMDRFRALPIVVVSYKDRAEDRDKALEAGANRYVTKSQFDTDVMLGMVAELLAEHGAAETRARA